MVANVNEYAVALQQLPQGCLLAGDRCSYLACPTDVECDQRVHTSLVGVQRSSHTFHKADPRQLSDWMAALKSTALRDGECGVAHRDGRLKDSSAREAEAGKENNLMNSCRQGQADGPCSPARQKACVSAATPTSRTGGRHVFASSAANRRETFPPPRGGFVVGLLGAPSRASPASSPKAPPTPPPVPLCFWRKFSNSTSSVNVDVHQRAKRRFATSSAQYTACHLSLAPRSDMPRRYPPGCHFHGGQREQVELIVAAFDEESVRWDLHLDTRPLAHASTSAPQTVPESWIVFLLLEGLESIPGRRRSRMVVLPVTAVLLRPPGTSFSKSCGGGFCARPDPPRAAPWKLRRRWAWRANDGPPVGGPTRGLSSSQRGDGSAAKASCIVGVGLLPAVPAQGEISQRPGREKRPDVLPPGLSARCVPRATFGHLTPTGRSSSPFLFMSWQGVGLPPSPLASTFSS